TPAQAGAPAAPFHAVFLGMVEPRKALHLGLEAWRNARAFEHARLSVYGHVVESYRPAISGFLSMPGGEFHEFTNDAAGAKCVHEATGLIHRAGDVGQLTEHLAMLIGQPALLARLRKGVLAQRD